MSKYKKEFRIWMICLCLSIFGLFTNASVAKGATMTGKVTASSLNVRQTASTKSTVVAGLRQGAVVTITATTTDSGGTRWYKISANVDGNTVIGYVSAQYVSITSGSSGSTSSSNTSSSTSTFLKRYGYVKADSLNVRSRPSAVAPLVTKLPKSKYVLVLDKTKNSGTTWYHVSFLQNGNAVRGYVSASHITLYTTTTSKTAYELATVKNTKLTAYKTANPYDVKRATLKSGQSVIIRGTLSVKGEKWAYVYAIVDGKGMLAYVKEASLCHVTATVDSTKNTLAVTTKDVAAKQIAATMAANVAKLSEDTRVYIKGSLMVLGKKWYKCTFKVSGTTYTGYILASGVEIPSDAEFLEELEAFPSSYHAGLRDLHEKNPNWHFEAVHTGLDWSTVIENESKAGRNVMQSNAPLGGSASAWSAPFSYLSTQAGAYDWSTDTYKVFDGKNWFSANSQVIGHYMDPRNALTSSGIWQFESLAYDSRQKVSVVESILSNTFMRGGYSVKDISTGKTVSGQYKDTFMEAGKQHGASPYFLAVRSKQELGLNGSGSVSGTYPGYTGYYNFFNIGANDSSTGQAIANGLRYASSGASYNRPWTNPYKSIVGGAEYIASSYIKRGQNTLYFQKFNVVSSPYYYHQYMTNVQAPSSEAKSTHNSYSNMGIDEGNFVFYIPVYKNMPSKPVNLPAQGGNPNSYLKNINVKNRTKSLTLTPTFQYQTKNYTMVVENNVSSVNVNANAISSYATVSGGGTVELTAGKTKTVNITCKAGNGTTTTYKIEIYRKAS